MKTKMDIPDKEGRKRLVIVGGGFGGLKLARKLSLICYLRSRSANR